MIVEILLSFGLYKIKVYVTQKNKRIRIRDARQKQDQDRSVQDKDLLIQNYDLGM